MRKISETCRCRPSLSLFCEGDGLDIGYGGDPIVPEAICLDLPDRYANYGSFPQNLHGDGANLYWFRDGVLDYVYSSHVLEDFEDTATVLKEWLRAIKPGGRIVLYLPDEKDYRRFCQKKGLPPNTNHRHENFGISYLKRIVSDMNDIEVEHERYPVHEYSFELVLRKLY